MKPLNPLPLDSCWSSADEYVESLLTFVSTSDIFRNLCGGVHVLDFLTRKPDLYTWILPQEWRDWFEQIEIDDILDLLLRDDLTQVPTDARTTWKGKPLPPSTLVEYTRSIRCHSLLRDFTARNTNSKHDLESLPRHVAVGMKPKKIHEVSQFATFVDDLSRYVSERASYKAQCVAETFGKSGPDANHNLDQNASSLDPVVIDFGSGQNYLGRTLACTPYNKKVIAIEQRHHNVEGARGMDVSANLAKKEKKMINKKDWKAQWEASRSRAQCVDNEVTSSAIDVTDVSLDALKDMESRIPVGILDSEDETSQQNASDKHPSKAIEDQFVSRKHRSGYKPTSQNTIAERAVHSGSIEYVEKQLSTGDLNDILSAKTPCSLVVSIHSCGNLTHHGLRSLILNPGVQAVAMIGCCYNLLTERLGPPTYKLPTLRSNHPRLEATSTAFDPHGFPMSNKLENFTYPIMNTCTDSSRRRVYNLNGELQDLDVTGRGVRLNITARMMAVQAPHNWGPKDSEDFFTRHYYRALLQRMLLDVGVVKMAKADSVEDVEIAGGTLSGKDDAGSPLIIGSLPKNAFASFATYVRAAVGKLVKNSADGDFIAEKTKPLVADDGDLISRYEQEYFYAKKHLSVIWSLMAFSASVVESTILVDRWLWLKEQVEVEDAWIEGVFDYKQSPRNMVVVGIKKNNAR